MRAVVIFSAMVFFACDAPTQKTPAPFVPCTVTPTAVDFGEADATIEGASVRTRIRVRNQSGKDRNLMLLPLGRPYSMLPVDGAFKLPAGSTRDITVFFTPTDGSLHLDALRLVDDGNGDGACEVTVPLRGLGGGTLSLGGTPSSLDFGFMEPGGTQRLALNVANSTREPIRLTAVNVVFDSGFTLPEPVTLHEPTTLIVPASGNLPFELVASPQLVGTVTGRVVISSANTTLETHFAVTVGRPEADVFPASVGPWLVGFDPISRSHGFSQRALRLTNVGNSGPSAEAGLRVTSILISGFGSSSSELTVNVPPQAFQGLASGESAQLVFELQPTSIGPKNFVVTLFTNSPSSPRVVIPVSASVEVLPACQLAVTPENELRLSPLDEGRSVGSITFTNVGETRCIVDDLRLVDGAENEFSIINDDRPQVELLPREGHTAVVIGPRTGNVMRVGAFSFHVFNPNSQAQLIDLYSTP